ncbi:MAG: DUF456 domain-containing protein [Holophagaceae bacterium]|nr:DUF456 domain-containing protein [Holophagaceae bacterium]
MAWTPWVAWPACALLLVVGFLGAFLPVIPGLPLMALGVGIHKLLLPEVLSWWTVALFIATALLAYALDFAATAFTAKWAGAGKAGISGALLGGIIGLFFALPGLILGPFIGALLGEWLISKRPFKQALKSGAGAALGLLVGSLGKGFLGLFLIVVFLLDAFLL